MKTLVQKGLCLLLVLGAQIFAQRFTATEPDIFQTGRQWGVPKPTIEGYLPASKQAAVLGEKNSIYANLMLLGGRDTILEGQESVGSYNVVNSHGNVLGVVLPFKAPNTFPASDGDTIHDNYVTAVAVLDSLSDIKKTATVIFASLRRFAIVQITVSNASSVSYSVLSNSNMPESMWATDNMYYASNGIRRKLALLGTSEEGTGKVYHLATGNPYYKNGLYEKSGRVDFFDIREGSWSILQPNAKGLANGENGLFFGEYSCFGADLAVIDNFDKKGGKALAVLLPSSTQFPNSALYIFQMDNDWTPSTKLPIVIAGSSKPWLEEHNQSQRCGGLGIANLEDENTHLFISCLVELPAVNDGDISHIVTIKDIVLDSMGNISNSSSFSSEKIAIKYPMPATYPIHSNPIAIKKHKNDLTSIFHALYLNISSSYTHSIAIFTLMDADYSKNFPIEAGKQEVIANIDSLFYKSGTTGFSAKTIFGLAQCEIANNYLLCFGEEAAIGSWSSIELSSASGCDPFKACKRKDTIFVYVRSANESPNTALRIPKSIVLPFHEQIHFNNLKSLAYFKNPDLKDTEIRWNSNGLKLSAATSNNPNSLSIIPYSQKEGTDTLIFNLSISGITNSYPIIIHIADTSKILQSAVLDSDTIWNTAQRKYIVLPDTYIYDINQNALGAYAEIIDNYLHILKVDVAEISIAYTENSEIKYLNITLMPESEPLPPPPDTPKPDLPPTLAASNAFAQNLNAAFINGGIQINGINGELELKAYNFKGMEIQSERAISQGSIFIKLNQTGPQIVQIKSANGRVYLKAAR